MLFGKQIKAKNTTDWLSSMRIFFSQILLENLNLLEVTSRFFLDKIIQFKVIQKLSGEAGH